MAHQPASGPLERALSGLQKNWKTLAKIGVWIVPLITSFVQAPPLWDLQIRDTGLFRFGEFIVTGLVGLWFVPISLFRTRNYIWRWWFTALGLLILGVSGFFGYQFALDTSTAPYGGSRIVIGSIDHMNDDAKKYLSQPGMTIERLIADSAGATETIWPTDELVYRRNWIMALYILLLALFSSFVLAVAQSLDCTLSADTPPLTP